MYVCILQSLSTANPGIGGTPPKVPVAKVTQDYGDTVPYWRKNRNMKLSSNGINSSSKQMMSERRRQRRASYSDEDEEEVLDSIHRMVEAQNSMITEQSARLERGLSMNLDELDGDLRAGGGAGGAGGESSGAVTATATFVIDRLATIERCRLR